MAQYAIQVKDLYKKYRIEQGAKPQYRTIRDSLSQFLLSPFNGKQKNAGPQISTQGDRIDKAKHILWALRGISLEIRPGEVLGLIGANGAGKSTLLKILTRITYPDRGSIDLYGRVGSLLEVGTGFHKELTGRENVYLNGAILGMRKAEIDRKFDEIVEFSDMSEFIDTPVKFYSSGMGVRLAFAVAAHLETEILLVDEVLAVGDATFQKKSLNKMESVSKEGRTVILISHHLPSITRLCERAILLDEGKMVMDGYAPDVVSYYLSNALRTQSQATWPVLSEAPGNEIVKLRSIRIINEKNTLNENFDIREAVGIEMEYEVLTEGYVLYPGFSVHNEEGQWLFASLDSDLSWRGKPRPRGRYVSVGWIPGNILAEGTMVVGPSIRTEYPNMLHVYEREVVAFQVSETINEKISARIDYAGRYPGLMRPLLKWETLVSPLRKQL